VGIICILLRVALQPGIHIKPNLEEMIALKTLETMKNKKTGITVIFSHLLFANSPPNQPKPRRAAPII